MFQVQVNSGAMPLKTIPAGAATQVLAATAPEERCLSSRLPDL